MGLAVGQVMTVGADTKLTDETKLSGRRVALVGRLASMSRRDAETLIRQRGGRLAEGIDAADWVVVRDEAVDLPRTADRELFDAAARAAFERGEVELVRESDFWSRLGLVESQCGVARLYTPAMLASLVRAPIAAIRQWHRQDWLQATREVRRLPYFDFGEVCVARKLAALLAAGCSLSVVNRKLGELARLLPDIARPLADADIVVEGRCLYVRRGEGLAEPSGQLLIDFSGPRPEPTDEFADHGPVAFPFAPAEALRHAAPQQRESPPYAGDDLRSLAAELEECGRSDQAIEVCRAILVSGQFTPEDHFALAELLYRSGELTAARERYYVAIELDEDFVEARSNLGCVLAEQGELELAEAAFRGALACHPDYADAHYHLARLLDRLGNVEEAAVYWKQFTELAPASPWADEAHDRIRQSTAP